MSTPNKIPGSDVIEDNGLSCPYTPAPDSSSSEVNSSSSETVIAVRDGVEYVQDDARQMSYSRPVSSSLPAHHVLLMTAPAANSQERRAALALGRALERVIGEMERSGEIIPAQVYQLCDILKRGEFPTHDEVWNNPFFNQSLVDTRLDTVVHAVAVKVAGDNQLHQTALALSLNYYFSQNSSNPADQDIRQGLITALSTDTQSRQILAQATQNSSSTVRAEVTQASLREAVTAAESAAAGGASARSAGSIAGPVAAAPTPFQTGVATAIRVATLTNPSLSPLVAGARLAYTVLGLERNGLPPYQESLLWPAPIGGLGQGTYFPLVIKDLPFLNEALGFQAPSNSSSDLRSAGEIPAGRGAPEAPTPRGGGSRAPAPEAPAPSHPSHPGPAEPAGVRSYLPHALNAFGSSFATQTFLGALPSPFTMAALALQGGYNLALLSQASSNASHSAFASYAPYAIAAVNSASETHADSDASHSDSSGGQSGGQGSQQQQDEKPQDERQPEQDVYLA